MKIPGCKKRELRLMLDKGSSVNIIKFSILDGSLPIDTRTRGLLSGITSESLETLGTVVLTLRQQEVQFSIVNDNFPIDADGILGRNYFKQEQAILSYHYNAMVIGNDPMRPIPFEEDTQIPISKTSIDSYLIKEEETQPLVTSNNNEQITNTIVIPRRTGKILTIKLKETKLAEG